MDVNRIFIMSTSMVCSSAGISSINHCNRSSYVVLDDCLEINRVRITGLSAQSGPCCRLSSSLWFMTSPRIRRPLQQFLGSSDKRGPIILVIVTTFRLSLKETNGRRNEGSIDISAPRLKVSTANCRQRSVNSCSRPATFQELNICPTVLTEWRSNENEC